MFILSYELAFTYNLRTYVYGFRIHKQVKFSIPKLIINNSFMIEKCFS